MAITIVEVTADIRQLSGIPEGFEGLPEGYEPENGQIWYSPFNAYHVEDGADDFLVSTEIHKQRLVDGIAVTGLPETPINNLMKVQLRGVRGYGAPWYVQIPATDCNLFDLPHVDPDTLDPIAPPSPAWLAALEAVQTEVTANTDGLETLTQTVADLELGAASDTAVATQVTDGTLTGAAVDARIADGITGKANAADVYDKTAADARYATTAQGVKADSAVQPAGLTKAAIGLGSVDNTADSAKPVSTAQAAADAAATAAAQASSAQKTSNLADLASPAAARATLAVAENSKLWPFRAALGKRDTRLVNIGILGASSTEGAFVGNFDRTLGQQLVKLLRNRYPTSGLAAGAGGRGFIGVPSKELTTSGQYVANMWPQTYTGGLFDPASAGAASAFDIGAKHMSWYTNSGSGSPKVVQALPAAVTSFEVHHAKGASGGATTAYYKADAGSIVPFATGTAVGLGKETGPAATSTIEVGWNGAGYLIFTGIREYAGDESKGIQVHNFGHSGMKIADWQDGYAVANSWREHLASFNLDLLILHDLGANDAFAGLTPAQVKTALLAYIVILRAGGITCPIVLSALFDPSGGAAVTPSWAAYATIMREIADGDATIVFVDHSVRMPSTALTDTLGLYSTVDHVHARADGAINKWQASTYDAILAAA